MQKEQYVVELHLLNGFCTNEWWNDLWKRGQKDKTYGEIHGAGDRGEA